MAMMMTGRVLLVCALCVLWCGAGGRCDDGDGDGRGVVGEPLPESPESRVESKAVSNSLKKRVEEAPTPAKESSEEEEGGDEATLQGEEGQQQQEGENALQVNEKKTPELLIKQNEAPQAPEVEGIPTAAALEESPTTPGVKAPTLQVPPPPPSQASGVGEGDGGLVGIGGTSRVTGEDIKDPKGREGPVSGPPSSGASSSTISNNGDTSGKNGGALPTQDTTSLKNNEQSEPTASSENAPLNRETPERSTHDAKQHSSDTQENETSQVADGDANYSTAGQSAVGTKATSGVSTTASNATTTPQPQPPAPPVPTTATVTGAT
ncbi:mucin-associated surface protein (MASP), partial [Trypanosoma cruzi]